MINREVYQKDPSTWKLANEGVANVNDDKSKQALDVLRYELETFVCDGQYEKGLEHILAIFLKNISQPEQPGVWISGFYGSGKSHLAKMLRALWLDTPFSNGSTARGIATLPQSISDHLRELSIQAKRHGGLHAASGTLGASASGSVRLALLSILFKSSDLPEHYPLARFVMWLKEEGIYDQVRARLENKGLGWQEELDNFLVAEDLHEALIEVKPNLFSSRNICAQVLLNQYPNVSDISNDDMIKTFRRVLTQNQSFPLTLVVLDEVQQYIGEDGLRANAVQEVVECCCKSFGGKLLFVGTGQTAISGTSHLKKLEGRFTVRVELSDTDVEAVIRKVILAKKPSANQQVDQVMQANIGEISRHLSGTSIGHRQDDLNHFIQDYPILPVRRRFWEATLHALDQTGTESQLRNQLGMIHKAIQINLDDSLGHVIPADYLYFDLADRLLQSRMLPRKLHEQTMSWINSSSADDRLKARACGLIFLINRLIGKNNGIGIRADADTIADLLIENLSGGSSALRSQLPVLLDNCSLLIKVGVEYRIQTAESAAWDNEFQNQRSNLVNQPHRIEAEREELLKALVKEKLKGLHVTQGASSVKREYYPVFGAQLPADHDKKVYVWIRDGWETDENSVRADARQAGNQSPTVSVFIPKRHASDLNHNLIDFKAASATLEIRGVPSGPEGIEARSAMETTLQVAKKKIEELLEAALKEAKVFQGGGSEVTNNDLASTVHEAVDHSLTRLYPQFQVSDHTGWPKVYEKAQKGAPDALIAVGYQGDPANNPVCKAILAHIAGGKKGDDIRKHFIEPEYGWSQDTVDGGLQALLVAGAIKAIDEHGKAVSPTGLERKAINKTTFKVESTTINPQQRIDIRRVMQKIGIQAVSGQESQSVPAFIQKLQELAESAGGDAPKPQLPDMSLIDDIRRAAGNDQLLVICNNKDKLIQYIDDWNRQAEEIRKRWPEWTGLLELLKHAGSLQVGQDVKQQVQAIESQRLLLENPDPLSPLIRTLEEELRKQLQAAQQAFEQELNELKTQLETEEAWRSLPQPERENLENQHQIELPPPLPVATRDELIKALEKQPLEHWKDRTDALSGRFARARKQAAIMLEPKTQTVELPHRTIKTEDEANAWLQDVETLLLDKLSSGPVVL